MPKKKKGGSGGGSGMPQGFDQVVSGINQWNDRFGSSYSGAEDYAQNNPWSQASSGWVNDTLSGSMDRNPWMSRLYGQTEGLDMNRGLEYLEDYLGGTSGENGGVRPRPRPVGGGGGGGYGGGGYTSSSSGGHIPDSTVGNKFFSQKVNALFDPSVLDPENDPTMQPMIDAIQRESEESYLRSITDLVNQAEGAGRYGGGLYQGMRAQQQDEYSEALQGTLAQQYRAARESALQRQMEALGLVNTRDISEGQIAAQLEAANMAASASGANARLGYDAEMDSHRLQAMQMMLGAGQFGMQMGGNMAELMQNGQIAANQIGQGWAQIGQHGYDQSAQFGQLGLGAMGQLGGIYSDAASARAAQERLAEQRRQWDEGAQSRDINDMIRLMTGLSDLGGYNDQMPYMPSSPGPSPDGFNWGDLLGSISGGLGTYYGMQQGGQ